MPEKKEKWALTAGLSQHSCGLDSPPHTRKTCLQSLFLNCGPSSQAESFSRCSVWVAGSVHWRPLVAASWSRPGWRLYVHLGHRKRALVGLVGQGGRPGKTVFNR